MSQQQQESFEEMGRGYQPQANYPVYPDPVPQSGDQFGGMSDLKIGSARFNHASPSVGQRLALSIVSICILGPMMLFSALVHGYRYNDFAGLLNVIIAISLVCISLLVVNLLFYKTRSGIASSNQKLALAIVSIGVLPLVVLMLGIGPFGLVIIGILCATILGINLLFSTMRQ